MRMYGYGNILATMSFSNPRLTRNIFSQLMNNRVEKKSEQVKQTYSSYYENLSNAVKNSKKTISDDKINAEVKKAEEILNKKIFPQTLTNYLNSTPLYTGKSSLMPDYSSIGGLINYLR